MITNQQLNEIENVISQVKVDFPILDTIFTPLIKEVRQEREESEKTREVLSGIVRSFVMEDGTLLVDEPLVRQAIERIHHLLDD